MPIVIKNTKRAGKINSITGGSLGRRMIAAKGADRGNHEAQRTMSESGALIAIGTIIIQAVKIKIIGVVSVCASCIDCANEPMAMNMAP